MHDTEGDGSGSIQSSCTTRYSWMGATWWAQGANEYGPQVVPEPTSVQSPNTYLAQAPLVTLPKTTQSRNYSRDCRILVNFQSAHALMDDWNDDCDTEGTVLCKRLPS